MHRLELILPWPPSVNHYKQVGRIVRTRNGKLYQQRVNSKATLDYYYEVYVRSKQGMPPEWLAVAQDSTISFSVCLFLSPPNNKRRDIDNIAKCAVDGLVHAKVIKDDSQIVRLLIEKVTGLRKGQVQTVIEVIER